MRQELDQGQKRYEPFSLLWKDTHTKNFFTLDNKMLEDLNITAFQAYMQHEFKLEVSEIIHEMPIDLEDSIYRQQVICDFTKYTDLYKTMVQYGEKAHHLLSLSKFAFEREATIYNLIKRMDEVETIRVYVETVFNSLKGCELESVGLKKYRELLSEIIDSSIYEAFTEDVKYIQSLENGVKSIQIGLNLDDYLQPTEAILLSISSEEFKYSRFGKKMGYYVKYGVSELKLIPRKLFARETVKAPDALNNLEKTIEPATLQLIKFCDQFNMKILEVLSILYHELPYFQVGVEMYRYLKDKNLPISIPKWEENLQLREMYNINLGFLLKEKDIVRNNIAFESAKPLTVLTGANRGGKTTLTQGLCQLIWFAQLGFYVPAQEAEIPYVDALLIHFAHEETTEISYGRLGEECLRFRKLYDQGSSKSFYLMNESFSGTSHLESLQIAVETIKAIYHKGGFVLFNTHLHELVESLEKEVPADAIKSLVAGKNMDLSPYLIEEGRPLGKSYAMNIAKKYQMTYEQLMKL